MNRSQSRRDFLARTAVAAGVAGMAGGAIGAGSRPIPRARRRAPLGQADTIRMGLIGTGGMGGGHMHSTMGQARRGEENVQIVALSDVCQTRLDEALNACRNGQDGVDVKGYRDYTELLERDDIHCVLVASPEHWHAKMSEDALLSGKDVYCEKPMTLRLPEALRLREVVNQNPDMIFTVGTQKIMLPKYRKARDLINDGALGHPTFSQTSYCRNSKDGEWLYYGIDPRVKPGETLDWENWCGPLGVQPWDTEVYHRWRRYRKWSTGIIGDLLVHQITPLLMSLERIGWPTRVVASGGHYIDKAMENHDQVNIQVTFENDHTMIIAGSTCNEVGLETMVRGHEANMYLNSRHVNIRPERLFAEEIDPYQVDCDDIGNDQEKLRLHWFDCIRKREQTYSTVDLGLKVMVIVDLATRSMWDGRAYQFDPSAMKASAI